MKPLQRSDLYSLEEYAEIRADLRARVMAHKRDRRLDLNDHARLYFEDRLTVQYQIQEMLRAEKIFDRAGILEELEVYNPLIPDGANWKATFMLEYEDPAVRTRELQKLAGVEHKVWMRVGDGEACFAIADEDLERSTADKTAAVHFMRFELSAGDVAELKNGAQLKAGIDHVAMGVEVDPVPAPIRESLLADLD